MRFATTQQRTSYGLLNGSTNFATIPANFSLELIGKRYLSGGGWFKLNGNLSTYSLNPHLLGIRCPTGTAAGLQVSVLPNGATRLGTDAGSATQNFDSTLTEFRPHSWNHVYCAVDLQTGLVRHWLNGVLIFQATGTFGGSVFTSGAGAISYIGANSVGTALMNGWTRDIVITFAPVTNNHVWELFTKGELPPDAYHWPCDDSRGTVLACYHDSQPWPMYDAALQGGGSLFSLDVPIPARIADNENNYLWLDGTADYYTISDDLVNPYIQGATALAEAGWAYLDRVPGGSASIFLLPESAGSSALNFTILNTGLFQGIARSRNGGFSSAFSPPTNHWANGYPIRQWFHHLQEVDYTRKTHKIWVNGRLCISGTAIPFEDNTFTCTPSGVSNIHFGSGSIAFPGRLGPIQLFIPRKPVTDTEAFDLYSQHRLPADISVIVDFRIPDLVAPVDVGPYRFPVNPISIVSPYGPQHRQFGGIGR